MFVIWGLLHGCALMIFRFWQKGSFRLPRFVSWLITFNFINAAWVFFRAQTFSDAVKVLKGMAGLTGVILSGIMAGGSARMADNLLLPTIATVIVGGTAITGGVGSVWRTVVGALIISVVRVGMQFVGVDVFAQQIVFGVMLVIAVAITIDRSKIPIVK